MANVLGTPVMWNENGAPGKWLASTIDGQRHLVYGNGYGSEWVAGHLITQR